MVNICEYLLLNKKQCYYNIGFTYHKLENFLKALDFYNSALKIYGFLYKDDINNEEIALVFLYLLDFYKKIFLKF